MCIRDRSKAARIAAYLEKLGRPRANACLVGDAVSDISEARKTGIPAVSVDWGFQDAGYLASRHPDYLVSSFEELDGVLRELEVGA